MKISMFNKEDIRGGAAQAAHRLYRGILNESIECKYIVAHKLLDEPCTIAPKNRIAQILALIKQPLDRIPLLLYPRRKTGFSLCWIPTSVHEKVKNFDPDIVHLHWIGAGFLSIESIAKFRKPIIWTLHDMWAFTGGCHYSGICERYQNRCGQCPQLMSNNKNDITSWILKRKQLAWKNIDLTIIVPSCWMKECALKSALFRDKRIEVIPNGIDLETFKPHEQLTARSTLHLPKDKKLILFGAMNPTGDKRKGFEKLNAALKTYSQTDNAGADVVVFGKSRPVYPLKSKMTYHYIGKLHDDVSLSLLYAAVDVTVIPSLEENLSNVVMESLACGTPVVAFKIGGMPDMIEHMKNGYLAKPYETDDLANGIQWVLADETRLSKLKENARADVSAKYAINIIVKKYLTLYDVLLKR